MAESWTYNTPLGTDTTGPKLTAICIVFTALSLLALSLRLYVRVLMIKAFGVDDILTIAAWITSAGFAIITILQTKWGLGLQNLSDMPEENVFNFGLLQYAGAPFYITSILGFKLALLFSYLRFIHTGPWRWATIVTIVLCIMFHISFLIVQINLCQPVAKQWDPSITEGSCLKGVPVYTSMASITMVFDVAVMVLPFPVLLSAKIQTRKKVVLLLLLGTGIFITIIQAIRIQTVAKLANYLDSAPLIMWSAIENNLGIVVACVPTLAPLVKYFAETTGLRSYYKSKSGSRKTGGRSRNGTGNDGNGAIGGNAYALSSWAADSRRDKTDLDRIGAGAGPGGSCSADVFHAKDGDAASTDSILGPKPAGIVKSTDIYVSETLERKPS